MNVQKIRLVDVFIIAPILIYAGLTKGVSLWLRIALIVIGLATLFYNGYNYLNPTRKDTDII